MVKTTTTKVIIIGQPNVGKSSLFNRLCGSRETIVSELSGTTRDLIGVSMSWRGKSFELIDSAGLDKPKDELSQAAITLIDQALSLADLIVLVVDGTLPPNEYDRRLARKALKTGQPVILAINKSDQLKKSQPPASFKRLGIEKIQPVSAIQGSSTGDLLDMIVSGLPAKTTTRQPADIRVAILGRPNVGKSSLLNKITGQTTAIISAVAGTTRDVNRGEIRYQGQTIELADTAGLRRSGKLGRQIEYFSSLRTKKAIDQSDICLLLIDAAEPDVHQDQKIAGLAAQAGKGLIIVINKWDTIEKDDKTMAYFAKQISRNFQFAWWAPLIFTSATTGQNVTELLQIITEVAARRKTRLATTQLNHLITDATAKQPPAGLRGKRPKIKYATQKGIEPPHFILFSSYPDLIHFSFYRYLENQLREAYDFSGTPIKIEASAKSKTRKTI